MNKIQGRRCLKLARFLEVEIASKPELFYFGQMMDVGGKEPKEAFEAGGGCGTVGCAVGWSPMAFPQELEWVKKQDLRIPRMPYLSKPVGKELGAPRDRELRSLGFRFSYVADCETIDEVDNFRSILRQIEERAAVVLKEAVA